MMRHSIHSIGAPGRVAIRGRLGRCPKKRARRDGALYLEYHFCRPGGQHDG